MRKRSGVERHYVNNRRLYECLVEYKAQPEEARRISDEIGLALKQIAERLAEAKNFRYYTYKDEMVLDAIENLVYAVPFFNPEKSRNPFGYFSLVANRAFIRRIQKEKKENYLKHKNFAKRWMESGGVGDSPNEHSDKVVSDYEAKMEELKVRKREAEAAAGLLKILD